MQEELRDVDPLTYAKNIKPENVVMVNAKNDSSLPERNIRQLWDALGKPDIHWFYMPFVNGHFYVAFCSKKVLQIVEEHFQRTLK